MKKKKEFSFLILFRYFDTDEIKKKKKINDLFHDDNDGAVRRVLFITYYLRRRLTYDLLYFLVNFLGGFFFVSPSTVCYDSRSTRPSVEGALTNFFFQNY